MTKFIKIHPDDNVAVAIHPVSKGELFEGTEAKEDIPQGHKIAIKDIKEG